MAKRNMIERENKRLKLVKKYKEKRLNILQSLKSVILYEGKLGLYSKLQKLPRNSAPSRLRNRCWVTGRGRGFYRDFGLSRHVLREMSHDCLLPGMTKSSW
uniref:Small ribosomal subunit protein uS14c n=1 Tax=Haptophyceae sp. NIES-3900 TaxID=2748608 RepID=A0A7R6WD31_9EUKA|nr:ribosomal protein S14 [Haptophyceae sp. NIES-3900]